MDSLTQIVLGASVGEATLGRKIGNKALLWGAIAGTIPDLDVFIGYYVDSVTKNEIHRGFSHSILFSILFAPIFGYLLFRLYKNQPATYKDWTKLFFWGLLTHPLLDAFTTWGTQLFWPWYYKVAINSIFVIDPLYTFPFLALVVLCMFYHCSSSTRRKFNLWGLYISSAYLMLTLCVKYHTYQIFNSSAKQQHIEFTDIQTRPTPFNIILWNANVQTDDAYYIGNYSLLDRSRSVSFTRFPKNLHLLEDYQNEPIVKRLIKLTKGWYTLREEEGKLYFNDLRFGVMDISLKNPDFVFRYELKKNDKAVLIAQQANNRKIKTIKPLLVKLWNRVLGRVE